MFKWYILLEFEMTGESHEQPRMQKLYMVV